MRAPTSSPAPTAASHPASLPASMASSVPAVIRPPARAAPKGWGFLSLTSQPWSYVWIDGIKQTQSTPFDKLRLSEGEHELRLYCPRSKKTETVRMKIVAGKATTKVAIFEP